MISASLTQSALVQDLLRALQDDELTDMTLVGRDGVEVPANRFVLAARSEVLRRMLYGCFKEASSTSIPLHYDGVVLEAVVEFCRRNEIPKFRLYIHRNAESARRLAQLYKAADYLQIEDLAKLVAQMSHNLTSRFPPLACAVYDESDLNTLISRDSLLMIQCRPYVTLPPHAETGGGIDCLSEEKLQEIIMDKEIKAGELFLFDMLQKWATQHCDHESREWAEQCATHLQLENIEPQDLLTVVKDSGLCSSQNITEAITQQALRASMNHVWNLSSRGRPNIERILVEGAGWQDANGIYYHIDGLANGELYSKQEVSSGQQHVYTLSISTNSDGESEGRIFCSKLLTHRSVQTLARSRNTKDPSFQPLMQIIWIEGDGDDGIQTNKYTLLQLSDGDYYINARIKTSGRGKEIARNSLVKVLSFDKYVADGHVAIHLKKVSIVSPDPGQKFGNPLFYFDMFDETDDDDGQTIVTSGTTPIENEISQGLLQRKDVESFLEPSQTLMELYSCTFVPEDKPIHSKLPISGWKVDAHGYAPVPKTRWIPGPATKPLKKDTASK